MRQFVRFIWNCLAVIGLVTVLSVPAGFLLLMLRTDLPPSTLAIKVVDKALSIFVPELLQHQKRPDVRPKNYPPSALSPHVSTAPMNKQGATTARILRVGPERDLKKPSEAAKIAESGDIIEIDAGLYYGDVALWRSPKLLIRGVGGRAVLNAEGHAVEGKAIWVIRSDDITIENIGFKKCRVRDRNGAGIRVEGDNLNIRNCFFRENENGILCGNLKEVKKLKVEYSEFGFNGYGDGQSHGIYVGAIDEFTFQYNYVHHTKSGHHVKSRADLNYIRYNYLTDLDDGNASYAIDLPDGGKAFIVGNILHQSRYTENSSLIHYGMPKSQKGHTFYIVNNTASSDRHTGVFLLNHSPAKAIIVNNLLFGSLDLAVGLNKEVANLYVGGSCLSPNNSLPFLISQTCKAVNAGFRTNIHDVKDLTPLYEYMHPLSRKMREQDNAIDIGAFEYGKDARPE